MSTVTHHDTEISVDPDVPIVRITREFDAPPEKVFRAHTDPELVRQWLGPRRLEMTVDHYDCRTGGSYRYVHRDDDGEYRFYGSFHEVRAPERIVQTFTFEGFPDGVSLDTLTLEDVGDGRTRLVVSSLLDSFEARDGMLASGMDVGSARATSAWTSCSHADASTTRAAASIGGRRPVRAGRADHQVVGFTGPRSQTSKNSPRSWPDTSS